MPPATPPTSAYMQSRVHYFGKTALSGGLGLLEWSSDGRLRLFALDPATQQPTNVVFACLPAEIQRAKVSLSMLELQLPDKKHRMDFSSNTLGWLAAGGLLGLFMASRSGKQSGVQWWADALRAQGINVKQANFGKTVAITLLVVFGVFLLLIVIGSFM